MLTEFLPSWYLGRYPERNIICVSYDMDFAERFSKKNRNKIRTVGGKVARVNAVSVLIETGHVFLPDPALHPWVEDYLDQFTAFPTAAHDDMVDSTSQVLTYFVSHSSGTAEEQRDTVELSTVEEQLFDVYG